MNRPPADGRAEVRETLGLERGVVRVVDYDAAWPALFAAESARLTRLLADGGLPIALEHMGSTAVPGLPAKPVLDILGGYPAGADVAAYVRALGASGLRAPWRAGHPRPRVLPARRPARLPPAPRRARR